MRRALGALLVTTLFVLTGCESLVLRPRDPLALKGLKITTRVSLAIATLYMSEIRIRCAGGAYTPDECARAWRAYLAVVFGSGHQPRESFQGCCSRHKGIWGCDYQQNRIVCMDGEFSPSCRCPSRNGYVDSYATLNALGCCAFGEAIACDYTVKRIWCSDRSYGSCACGP